jgi:hypothetical protein
MKPEDGLVHMAMGLGKTVVEGGMAFRFCPRYPQYLPQFSAVDDILRNTQRFFYALKMTNSGEITFMADDSTLARLEIDEVSGPSPLSRLAGEYVPEEHRIRDSAPTHGHPVLTFAGILKHELIPLSGILRDLLELGRNGMGSPVEIEFALNLPLSEANRPQLGVLQIRPMATCPGNADVTIGEDDIARAFCYSTRALGNGHCEDISDIVYVKPESFDPGRTIEIAGEIGLLNKALLNGSRKYLLIGFGRWGSADRWMGIPVHWNDISGVGAIIEASTHKLNADPSQGSHFFHNISSLGISYLTIVNRGEDFIRWEMLRGTDTKKDMAYLRWVSLKRSLKLKIDGKTSRAVVIL